MSRLSSMSATSSQMSAFSATPAGVIRSVSLSKSMLALARAPVWQSEQYFSKVAAAAGASGFGRGEGAVGRHRRRCAWRNGRLRDGSGGTRAADAPGARSAGPSPVGPRLRRDDGDERSEQESAEPQPFHPHSLPLTDSIDSNCRYASRQARLSPALPRKTPDFRPRLRASWRAARSYEHVGGAGDGHRHTDRGRLGDRAGGSRARGCRRRRGPGARPLRADGSGQGRAAAGRPIWRPTTRHRRWPSSPAGASGACRASTSTSRVSPARSPATPAAARAAPTTTRSAAATAATPRRCASPTIRARSAMARCCRSSSRWRTTRPSSIGRGRTSGRNTGRRSSRPTPSRPRWRRPTSPS